jgi:hypothetical protein
MNVCVYNVVGGVAFIYFEGTSSDKPTASGMVHDDEIWSLNCALAGNHAFATKNSLFEISFSEKGMIFTFWVADKCKKIFVAIERGAWLEIMTFIGGGDSETSFDVILDAKFKTERDIQ